MIEADTDELQEDLARYLRAVENGETVVVNRAGEPIAEFKPVFRTGSEPRPFGLCAGEFTVPDDFDAPLPDDVLAAFEGR